MRCTQTAIDQPRWRSLLRMDVISTSISSTGSWSRAQTLGRDRQWLVTLVCGSGSLIIPRTSSGGGWQAAFSRVTRKAWSPLLMSNKYEDAQGNGLLSNAPWCLLIPPEPTCFFFSYFAKMASCKMYYWKSNCSESFFFSLSIFNRFRFR